MAFPHGTFNNQKPPLGARIDWGNPITRKMFDCLVFNEAGSQAPINHASPTIITAKTNTPTWAVRPGGLCVSGGSTCFEIPDHGNIAAGDCTVRVIHRPTTWDAGGYGLLIGKSATGLNPREIGFMFDTSGNTSYNVIGQSEDGSSIATGMTINRTWDLCITRIGTTVTFYVDGAPKGTVTLAGTTAVAGERLALGLDRAGTAGPYVGFYFLVQTWLRGLTPHEVTSIYREPYGMFRQLPASRFFFSAGSAAAYTLTAAQGSFALTGQTATLLEKEVIAAAQASFTFTGQAAALKKGSKIAADQASFALTGQTVTLLEKEILTAAQASFTLTGQAATLKKNVPIVAAQASFTFTGQDASFALAHKVTAAQASFTLTGQAVAVARTYRMTATQASFALNGQTAGLNKGATMSAAQASYTLTGQAATLLEKEILAAAQAAFTFTGQAASLKAGHKIAAAQASFTLTGQNASFNYLHILAASQASFALTGQATGLRAQRQLTAAFGGYILTGNDATLTYLPHGVYAMNAGVGMFALNGQDVDLVETTTLTISLNNIVECYLAPGIPNVVPCYEVTGTEIFVPVRILPTGGPNIVPIRIVPRAGNVVPIKQFQ